MTCARPLPQHGMPPVDCSLRQLVLMQFSRLGPPSGCAIAVARTPAPSPGRPGSTDTVPLGRQSAAACTEQVYSWTNTQPLRCDISVLREINHAILNHALRFAAKCACKPALRGISALNMTQFTRAHWFIAACTVHIPKVKAHTDVVSHITSAQSVRCSHSFHVACTHTWTCNSDCQLAAVRA